MAEKIDQSEKTMTAGPFSGLVPWQAGVVAGIVGATAMGILVSLMKPAVLERIIPAMYTLSGGVVGWAIHLSHGAIIGIGFAALFRIAGFEETGPVTKIAMGFGWGVVTWVALAALVMPVWLMVVGVPMPPMVPNFAVPSLVWHLVYGLVLGGSYHLLR